MTRISDRTVLFADLRGSTALYESLGNAEATSVITHCVAAIGAPIKASGGQVIKTLGDGLMALFESPTHAVHAATLMQEVLTSMVMRGHERGASSGLRAMRLQVAMARGEVVEMGGDAFGDAVNVAARLIDHAGDNETLATDEVVQELAPEQRARFRSLDLLNLRGRVEQVRVYMLHDRRGSDLAPTQYGDVSAPVASPNGLRLHWLDQTEVFGGAQFPVVLGRNPQATFCVDDSRVSRSHCRVDWHGGSFQLSDLSFNGTYVRFADGEVVSLRRGSCTLHGQGVITLGGLPTDPTSASVDFEVVHVTSTRRDGRNAWVATR